MKVLIVHPSFGVYGGAELAIFYLTRYLRRRGVMVDITTNILHYQVRRDLRGLCGFHVMFSDDLYHGIAKYVHEHYKEYDVINMHNHPAELTLYPHKHPSVWYVNEPPQDVLDGKDVHESERVAVRDTVGEVITNSEHNQDVIRRVYGRRSSIVRYGVDHDFLDRYDLDNPVIRDLGIDDDDYVILHSGWWNPFKDQVYSVRVFRRFNKVVPGSKLVLSGYNKTPYARLVYDAIRRSGCGDKILVHDRVSKTEARDLCARADVLINPCRGQGSFLSTYEAISLGKTVIVRDDVPDIRLIRGHDLCIVSDDFYETLLDVYNGRLCVSGDARTWVRNNLTWDKYGEGVYNIMRDVVG